MPKVWYNKYRKQEKRGNKIMKIHFVQQAANATVQNCNMLVNASEATTVPGWMWIVIAAVAIGGIAAILWATYR